MENNVSAHYLLRIAGVNLYNIIKDTEQLSVYRGASLLLKQVISHFDLKDKKGFSEEEVKEKFFIQDIESISTGASEGLFLIAVIDNKKIEDVVDKIKNFFISDDNYKYFTFVVDAVSYKPDNFKSANEKLIAKSRFAQMQQFSVALPAWNTRLKEHKPVCPVDGIHAADQNKTISCPNENTFCSNSVSQRYLYGKDKKIKFVIDEVGDSELEFCNTLSEIAIDDSKDNKKGNLNNKIAVIYFDGNGFGSIQAACKNEEELKAFDNTMQTKRKEFPNAVYCHF